MWENQIISPTSVFKPLCHMFYSTEELWIVVSPFQEQEKNSFDSDLTAVFFRLSLIIWDLQSFPNPEISSYTLFVQLKCRKHKNCQLSPEITSIKSNGYFIWHITDCIFRSKQLLKAENIFCSNESGEIQDVEYKSGTIDTDWIPISEREDKALVFFSIILISHRNS